LPAVQDPTRRRTLSDIAIQIGVEDLTPLRGLLTNDQAYVALEAIHLLAGIDTPASRDLMLEAQAHPQAPVRLALLGAAETLDKEQQITLAVQFLDDREIEVRVAAARVLSQIRDIHAVRAIEARVKDPELAAQPLVVKQAFLSAYVMLAQVKGLPLLAKMFQDGGGLLAKKEAEELAVAAAHALGTLGTPGAISALRKAATFLNMRVRDAANEALKRARTKSA
jgi:HEAT repeat protein